MTAVVAPARSVVVMGVSGCGKTVVGKRLAELLDRRFVEADDLHPAANVAKMASGEPLDDGDRAPWLAAVAAVLAEAADEGEPVVLACSALKRAYRDRLREGARLLFVLLDVPPEVAEERVGDRGRHHFMPSSLVSSQFEALERPADDECDLVVVDATPAVDEVVARTLAAVRRRATDDAAEG